MAGTPLSSSASSCGSFGSYEEVSGKSPGPSSAGSTIKFLYSYGGKILPRRPDGKLRYVGGDTRVLAVDRSVPFYKLQARLKELSGLPAAAVMQLRCQLPTDDLDALVTVTNDDDLANLVDEYDIFASNTARDVKIRAFIVPAAASTKPLSPPPTPPLSSSSSPAARQFFYSKHMSPTSALQRVHPMARGACHLRHYHQPDGSALPPR